MILYRESVGQFKLRVLLLISGNGRAILLFLFFESVILIILAALVRFCCIFWRKKKLQDQDLGKFLEKRVSSKSFLFNLLQERGEG